MYLSTAWLSILSFSLAASIANSFRIKLDTYKTVPVGCFLGIIIDESGITAMSVSVFSGTSVILCCVKCLKLERNIVEINQQN